MRHLALALKVAGAGMALVTILLRGSPQFGGDALVPAAVGFALFYLGIRLARRRA